MEYWIVGAATAIVLFVCVVLHQLGHALVARHYQVSVARIPRFIFEGFARLDTELSGAKAKFWIALAGPVVSLALAAMFGLLQVLAGGADWPQTSARNLVLMNGGLALFSIIPGLPFDGGWVVQAIVSKGTHNLQRAKRVVGPVGLVSAFLVIISGTWFLLHADIIDGLWIILIGWFLERASVGQARRQ